MGIITDVILPLALAFIMFSLGLGLTSKDFSRVIKQPKDFLVGAFSVLCLGPALRCFHLFLPSAALDPQ